MFQLKVSIIVPVYNVEQWLPRCIDSILGQTMSDFELLLIDDGSVDRSGEICDEYAIKDSRIRVFHKKNEGVSSARNLGINNAFGQYIMFVDADDWIDSDMLFCMTSEIIDSKSDIVACDFVKETLDGNSISRYAYDEECGGEKLLELYLDSHYISSWGKLISTNLFYSCGVLYDEGISYGEDSLIMVKLRHFSKKTKIIHKPFYHYNRLNVTSACANFSEKHQSDSIVVARLIETFFKQEGVLNKYKIVVNYFKFVSKQNILRQQKNLDLWRSIYPECHKDIFKFNCFTFLGRCKWWLCAYMPYSILSVCFKLKYIK